MPSATRHLSVVRSGPAPAVGFIRPMLRDVKELVEQFATGLGVADGLVFDPRVVEQARWPDLAKACGDHQIPLVLDTLGVEVRAPGTREASSAKAPWASALLDYDPYLTAAAIADFCSENPAFSAVLAPSFPIPDTSTTLRSVDPTVTELREALDNVGREDLQIHYPLVGTLNVLEAMTSHIIGNLRKLPVDALWLRVHRGGREASRDTIRRYVRWCRSLHELQLPLVGDYTGQLGVGLYAFGALSGFSSGLTFGDLPDVGKMLRNDSKSSYPFSPAPRVYIPEVDLYLTRDRAQKFFETRPHKSAYGCKRACCRRGVADMIAEPRRHFMARRQEHLRRLGQVPPHLSADTWMDEWLRPASDSSFSLAGRDQSYKKTAKRLRGWREAFVAQRQEDQTESSVSRGLPMIAARETQDNFEGQSPSSS